MGDSGWTVSDPSRPAKKSSLSSGGASSSCCNGLQAATSATAAPSSAHQSAGGASRVRWSDSLTRSRSGEDLDRLLDGLEQLTQTLPDLTRAVEEAQNKAKQANSSSSKAIQSPPSSVDDPDQPRSSGTQISTNVFPNVKKTRQLLQTRDTYNLPSPGGGSPSSAVMKQPYHTLQDSKPFSYIPSQPTARSMSRTSSRETLLSQQQPPQQGLESPSLLRKILGNGCGAPDSSSAVSTPTVTVSVNLTPTNPSRNNGFHAPQTVVPITISHDLSETDSEATLTWLEKQKRKLQEKRELERRRLTKGGGLSPLQPATDDYASDLASNLYSETSTRESSPHKNSSAYSVPVTVEAAYRNGNGVKQSGSSNNHVTTSVNYHTLMATPPSYKTMKTMTLSGGGSGGSSNGKAGLSRQKSDTSFDRMRPFLSRRLRHDSESEAELQDMASWHHHRLHGSNASIDSALQWPSSRPITPGFPAAAPSTPYFNQSASSCKASSSSVSSGHALFQQRCHSPAAASTASSSEPAEVSPLHVKLAKESHTFWYKPQLSREQAIGLLEARPPGSFVVRDSNSFPGAFGLALKVATPPPASQTRSGEASADLVRHFLIEPTSKGVKLKGYNNEPVFASLSALVYQHTLTQLALPARLVLPQADLAPPRHLSKNGGGAGGGGGGGGAGDPGRHNTDSSRASTASQQQLAQLLQQGAACNVHFLFSLDTDTLTGPEAVRKAVRAALAARPKPTLVHFKVSAQGITLTDRARKLFFRKHHNTAAVSFCGLDPDDRRWSQPGEGSLRIFAFVAKKHNSHSAGHNQCHVFAEAEPEQPAKAIVNFVNKVLLAGAKDKI